MVSFQCDACADTVKKPKLDQHRTRCHAPFTCLDCSTTFRGTEYKSHTSCISEAQKYQGALYKGLKKGKQPYQPPKPTFTEAPPPPLPNPSGPSSPSGSGTATPAIHPSRLNQVQVQVQLPTTSHFPPPPSYASPAGGGGGFGYGAGGGGGGGGRGAGRFGRGGGSGPTSENRLQGAGGMRSWGSPIITEDPASAPAVAQPVKTVNGEEGEKKKRKKKGDKGGTGSKANTKSKSETGDIPIAAVADEPERKKRKRDLETSAVDVVPSDKTLKRLKKNLAKLEKGGASQVLSDWLEKASKGKEGSLDSGEVLKGLKVSLEDGKWVLSA